MCLCHHLWFRGQVEGGERVPILTRRGSPAFYLILQGTPLCATVGKKYETPKSLYGVTW